MPSVLIEVRHPLMADEAGVLMQCVHGALKEAFCLLPTDRNVRVVAHDPAFFQWPPNMAQPDRFTQVTVDAFVGRSLETKRSFYRSVVERLEPLGIAKDHVRIILRESPLENWGIGGGQAACDVDLGFKINV